MMRTIMILTIAAGLFWIDGAGWCGQKNRVGQSGMTYLGISMSARVNAMGDAATATVKGIQGIWHNPSVLADIRRGAVALNQVNWLVDTKLYGAAVAWSFGNRGTIALGLTYMDWGTIAGTRPVDRTVNPRGFEFTGDIKPEDYAIGLAYARRISDRLAIGITVKRLHESLGTSAYVVGEYIDPATGVYVREHEEKEWVLNDWGVDIGTTYDVGWKSLAFAMSLMNFSRNMKYFYEEFQTPATMRIGLAMDVFDLWEEIPEVYSLTVAVDALHPNDHTESVHIGSELVLYHKLALRGGYKFNHGVEAATFGVGVNFSFADTAMQLNYAYGTAHYFEDLNRLSLQFSF